MGGGERGGRGVGELSWNLLGKDADRVRRVSNRYALYEGIPAGCATPRSYVANPWHPCLICEGILPVGGGERGGGELGSSARQIRSAGHPLKLKTLTQILI